MVIYTVTDGDGGGGGAALVKRMKCSVAAAAPSLAVRVCISGGFARTAAARAE